MKKRILALFLACMMIVSVIAVPAFAEEECAHEDVTYTPLKDGEALPTKCTESAVCLWVCNDCGESAYKKLTGDHNMEVTYVEATCEEPAKAGEKCTYCGLESEMTEVDEALGHDWVPDFDNEDYKIPTCTEGGKIVNKCSRCNKVLTSDMAPSDHVWDFVDTVEATCEYGAGLLYRCLLCNDTKVEEFKEGVDSAYAPKLQHKWVAGTKKDATCSEKGYENFYYCEVCEEIDPERAGNEIPKNENHKPELVQTLKAATCTANGVGKYACELCEKDLGYGVIPAAHELYVYSTTAPTCAKDGEIVKRCKKGCTVGSGTDKKPYEEKTVLESDDVECTWVVGTIEATCTTVEMYGTHCSVCGDHKAPGAEGSDVVVVGEEALGHDYVIHWNDIKNGNTVIGKKPTCTENGLFYVTCGRCDATWGSKATPVNSANSTYTWTAPGHTLDMTSGEYVDETCVTANGMKYLCTKCGEYQTIYFTSADGNHFIGQKNHDWGEKSNKTATCYEKGYTGKQTCKRAGCGAVQYEKTPDATGLDPNNHGAHEVTKKILKEATCTTRGVKQVGCTTPGCSAYVAYKVIPFGHNYEEVKAETVAPECDKPGYKKSICSVCGHVKEEELTLNHEYVALETANQFTVPATCHRPGKKATKICKHCGAFDEASLIDYTNAPAKKNHVWTNMIDCEVDEDGKINGKVPEYPSCTETGWGYVVCSLCGCDRNDHRDANDATDYGTQESPVVLPVLAHPYGGKVYVDATCTRVNGFEQTCDVCGDVKFTAMTGEAAYGPVAHTWVEKGTFEGNCQYSGYVNGKVCSVCWTWVADSWGTLQPDKHVGKLVTILKAPTCNTNGVGQYVCQNPACDGKVYFAAITAGHTWNTDNLLVSESNNAIYIECDACDAVKVHEYLGEGDDVTGETLDSLKLNATVNISGAVSNSAAIVVKVSNVAGYSNIQIVVNGEVVTESTNANGVYTFVYKTAVSNMDDTFEVVVKGEKFGIVCTADVETFEFALLEDDLSIIPVATTKIEDATASFVGRGVLIGETVKLLYHVKASETASVVLKKYGSNTVYETIDLADLTAVDGVYVIEVEVDAADWDQVFSASVVDAEGNVISNTNHYSVAQYAANNIKGTDKLSTVLSAMMQAIAD